MEYPNIKSVFAQPLLLFILLISNNGSAVDTKISENHHDRAEAYTEVLKPGKKQTINRLIKKYMADNKIPGMAVAIVTNPKKPVIWSKGYGVKSLVSNERVTRNTSFWLASISKVVVGTAIAKAQEDGYLYLDQEIQNLLTGDNFNIDNPGSSPITIRDLVTHSSGIKDGTAYQCSYYIDHGDGTHTKLVNLIEPGLCPDSSPITLDGFLGAYLDSEGEFYDSSSNYTGLPPGQGYKYSNIAAALAGYAVELSTSLTLAEYAEQEIFSPLGMHNTSWNFSKLNQSNLAAPHTTLDNTLSAIPFYELATWPDGGLRSSASDMAKFLATIMNEGTFFSRKSEVRILEPGSVTQMLTPIQNGFGIFWYSDWLWNYGGKDHILIGHNGAEIGYFSYMVFNPKDNVGVILLANTDRGDKIESIEELIKDLFEATQVRRQPVSGL
ncbi:serine hydrolase domain-containing protein [Microbulbifer sp. JMSA004]|uniref:serine hydrolase domain-containing protein n=1 Tax=Microbulbifer sp. JMSA004 TaxID=3243370 RepID=UPI004039201A